MIRLSLHNADWLPKMRVEGDVGEPCLLASMMQQWVYQRYGV